MNDPGTPKLEAILSDRVALYDGSHLLERRDKPAKRRRSSRTRDVDRICYVIVHKSGADGPSGIRGAQGMARFVVKHREWDDPAYTFWFPRVPELDANGRFIVYRCNPDPVRSWHTGGVMNTLGVSFGVQGNYDGDGGEIEITQTDAQTVCLEAMIPYCEQRYTRFRRHDLDDRGGYLLTGHWEHGKSVCPGDSLQKWVRGVRLEGERMRALTVRPAEREEVDPLRMGRRSRQVALHAVGYDPGPFDGIWGYRSRGALESFQRAHRLKADGHWGMHTAAAMLAELRARGIASADTFADLGDGDNG